MFCGGNWFIGGIGACHVKNIDDSKILYLSIKIKIYIFKYRVDLEHLLDIKMLLSEWFHSSMDIAEVR